MKTQETFIPSLRHILPGILASLAVACGKGVDGRMFGLDLQFPEGLRRSSERFDRFLARAQHLQVSWRTRSGQKGERRVPVQEWKRISIPLPTFPGSLEDALSIEVKVWDLERGSNPRPFPVLSGSGRIAAGDLRPEEPILVPIRLSLHTSVREFD